MTAHIDETYNDAIEDQFELKAHQAKCDKYCEDRDFKLICDYYAMEYGFGQYCSWLEFKY